MEVEQRYRKEDDTLWLFLELASPTSNLRVIIDTEYRLGLVHHFSYRGNSQRCNGAASHFNDMLLQYRSPIPVGRKGGGGQHSVCTQPILVNLDRPHWTRLDREVTIWLFILERMGDCVWEPILALAKKLGFHTIFVPDTTLYPQNSLCYSMDLRCKQNWPLWKNTADFQGSLIESSEDLFFKCYLLRFVD